MSACQRSSDWRLRASSAKVCFTSLRRTSWARAYPDFPLPAHASGLIAVAGELMDALGMAWAAVTQGGGGPTPEFPGGAIPQAMQIFLLDALYGAGEATALTSLSAASTDAYTRQWLDAVLTADLTADWTAQVAAAALNGEPAPPLNLASEELRWAAVLQHQARARADVQHAAGGRDDGARGGGGTVAAVATAAMAADAAHAVGDAAAAGADGGQSGGASASAAASPQSVTTDAMSVSPTGPLGPTPDEGSGQVGGQHG